MGLPGKVATSLTQVWDPQHSSGAVCMQHLASTPVMLGGLPWPPWLAGLMKCVEAFLTSHASSRGCTQAALHAHTQLPKHQVPYLRLSWLDLHMAGGHACWEWLGMAPLVVDECAMKEGCTAHTMGAPPACHTFCRKPPKVSGYSHIAPNQGP